MDSPEGEWRVLSARCPAPGAVVPCPDEGVVLWASQDGSVHVAPDLCPHLAMPYAWEGVVIADDLVCCSHGWRLGPDGEMFKISMNGRRDPKGHLSLPETRVSGDIVQVQADFDPLDDRFRSVTD